MKSHDWPGNVRELRNVIERAVLLVEDGTITPECLPAEKMRARLTPPSGAVAGAALKHQVESLERQQIIEALERCGGNQTQAAKFLGVSRRMLIGRLAKLGLPRPRNGQCE